MEIKKYLEIQDMARIGCNDCEGCYACCQNMGDSVILTPYDVYQLSKNLQLSVDELFQEWIQLTVVDGLLQPSMAMNGSEERCHALNAEGRCSIHGFRPSICRLFPLGRQYLGQEIKYFVLQNACPAPVKSKIKIEKWIERIEFKEHESFLLHWHNFKKKCMQCIEEKGDSEYAKQVMMYVFQMFYRKPYVERDFYHEFLGRIKEAENVIS